MRGGPLSPLLFSLVTRPLFYMLERYAKDGTLYDIKIRNKNMPSLGFDDDIFMFSKACNLNLTTCITVLNMYANATRFLLNVYKSILINLNAVDFECLI